MHLSSSLKIDERLKFLDYIAKKEKFFENRNCG